MAFNAERMRTDETAEGESVRDRMIDGAGTEETCSMDASQDFCRRGQNPTGSAFLHPALEALGSSI